MSKGRERTGKFYLANEKRIMKSLGLKATIGSGNGPIEKEDGQNEFVIAQLKSTDKESFTIKRLDIDKLEYNAAIARKIPIFIVQFLKDDKMYFLAAVEDICNLAEYLETGEVEIKEALIGGCNDKPLIKAVVKSSTKSKQQFKKQREEKYKRRK